jgi:hypothetical protein
MGEYHKYKKFRHMEACLFSSGAAVTEEPVRTKSPFHGSRGIYDIGSHYQATTGEETAH